MRRLATTWPDENRGFAYKDTIKAADAGKTVLEYYVQHYPASGTDVLWTERIVAGQVEINGFVAACDSAIKTGDLLTYTRRPWREPDAPNYVDVVFEDEHVVAVNKPSRLQVLPAALFFERTVLTLLQQHYAGFRMSPAPVHRLGRGTSGLLVCAMSPEARRALTADLTAKTQQQAGAGPPPPRNGRERRNQQQQAVQQVVQQAQQDDGEDSVIRQKYMQPTFTNAAAETNPAGAVEIATQTQQRAPLVQKIYRALVQGHVSEDSGEVEAAIGPIPYPGVDGGLFAASASGKAARSSWRVLERRGPGSAGPGPGPGSGSCEACTLMEVEIFTGRPHQIRIHMAYIGHPLVGDPLYGRGGVPKAGLDMSQLDDDGGMLAAPVPAQGGPPGLAPGPQGADAGTSADSSTPVEHRNDPTRPGPCSGPGTGSAGVRQPGVDPPRVGVALPGDCGYLLHSYSMALNHPISGQRLTLIAPPPPQLMTAVELHAQQHVS